MNQEKCIKILKELKKVIANPKTELRYNSPFELLIAVILSAHTTDVSVNRATEKLFKVASTPKKMLTLGEAKLARHIRSIGLYKAKAAYVIKTCRILIDKYNSKIPDTSEELESLPGVGRKTANVILNIVFNKPVIAVDTHIFRVSNRTKLAIGKNPLEVEKKLTSLIPKNFIHDAHHLLLLHGRYTCTAKNPHCKKCVIKDLCEFEAKNL
ncbi:MAG: endonuclease III [Coxiella sp. DG_40]|nr:MAG: endonuclease III [Coxiella sp. DG_40]